jgi:hypothetical protein
VIPEGANRHALDYLDSSCVAAAPYSVGLVLGCRRSATAPLDPSGKCATPEQRPVLVLDRGLAPQEVAPSNCIRLPTTLMFLYASRTAIGGNPASVVEWASRPESAADASDEHPRF